MSQLGQSRRFRDVGYESASPPRTDIVSRADHVGKVPSNPDLAVVENDKERVAGRRLLIQSRSVDVISNSYHPSIVASPTNTRNV
jgi:hypothetical protein